jgi:hypothetical protein
MVKQALENVHVISISSFFYITDLINRNKIEIEYCPTEDMIAN